MVRRLRFFTAHISNTYLAGTLDFGTSNCSTGLRGVYQFGVFGALGIVMGPCRAGSGGSED